MNCDHSLIPGVYLDCVVVCYGDQQLLVPGAEGSGVHALTVLELRHQAPVVSS